MATTQYIGARYVPLFAEPIEWDKTKQYEPLTIVTHNGNSYTSRQFVPTGIEITNETFWALTGNYNAQIEQYRKEVTAYDGRITTAQDTADSAKASAAAATTAAGNATTAAGNAATAVAEEKTRAEAKESQLQSLAETNKTDITHLDSQMAATTGSELLTRITNEVTNRTEADTSLETSLTELINGKFPVQTSNLADGAVTTPKIADGAVTAPNIATSAINSILQGFTIKRFDSTDSSADNTGLRVPTSDCVLKGFYIVELEILVIENLHIVDSVWGPTSNNVTLPSYVVNPNKTVQLSRFGVIVSEGSNDFVKWSGLRYATSRYLHPNSSDNKSSQTFDLPGTCVAYLRPYDSGASVSTNIYDAFASHNGVI